MRGWRIALHLALPALLAGCAASTLPSVHSEAERLSLARRLAQNHNYTDATTLLKTYIDHNAGSAEVDHAVYLLGECYLGSKDYALGAVEFERLLREFPESDSAGSAEFQLGAAYYGQARPADFDQEYTRKALDQWQRFLTDRPDHWRVPDAKHRVQLARMKLAGKLIDTGNLYVKLRDLGPARAYYHEVEEEYSDLPQLADAWVGLARCDVLEKHPADAIERLKQVESRFAGRPIAAVALRERERLTR
jgi:outer membrane protein assembly factor BamD